MRCLHAAVTAALVATLLTACGDGGSGGEVSSADDPDDTSWCKELDVDGRPTADLVDAVPERHQDAAALLVAYVSRDATGPSIPRTAEEFASSLTGEEPTFAEFAASIERACGAPGASSVRGVAALGTLATLVGEPLDIPYCTALTVVVTADSEERPVEELPADLAALSAGSPASHQAVLLDIGAAASAPPADVESQSALVAEYAGIGLYAEAVCGARGAMVAMAFAGALAAVDPTDEG